MPPIDFPRRIGACSVAAGHAGRAAREKDQMARAAGFNKEDGTAVIKVLERLAGVRVGRTDAPPEGAR